MPSAGVTATSKDGSSIINIHPMNQVVPPHVPFYDNTNQVTEWAPVLHPIVGSGVPQMNSLKNTLSTALKSVDMIGVGNDGENSP